MLDRPQSDFIYLKVQNFTIIRSMKYLLLTTILFLVACSTHTYEKQVKLVVLKTSKIKFADIAYVGQANDAVVLELYIAGKALKTISIDRLVCVADEGCLSKSSFNKEYLFDGYPEDLMKNVLLGKPIYESKNVKYLQGEMLQVIQEKNVDITYRVSTHRIYFKDKTNNILISIKEL